MLRRTLAMVLLALIPAAVRADDPPEVTAKGWAILDGKTGALIAGHEADEPRKAASTTKIMCARVVLQMAEKEPKILDETVIISQLADDTSGSTADVRVGEKLPVRELLYGLLLPSGNDAGNALAQHFNSRCEKPDDALLQRTGMDPKKMTTRINFIAEMNREAAKLGMKQTIYRSAFGDGGSDTDRTTTPHELATLAFETMKNERFREYVRTRKYECKVRTPDGGERTATWTNTNRLLAKADYDGVKTGTTSLAGSCLVSRRVVDEGTFIVVVLGSKANDDRYSDSEALHEWARKKKK